jgi:hypothetical protein
MTFTLNLNAEIEQGLLAQAQARGVSLDDYLREIVTREVRLTSPGAAPRKTLLEFFRESPLVGLELEFERGNDLGRDITL